LDFLTGESEVLVEKLKVCGGVASFCEGFAVEVVLLEFFGVCEVLTD